MPDGDSAYNRHRHVEIAKPLNNIESNRAFIEPAML